MITHVEVQAKENTADQPSVEEKVETGIQQLASQYVEAHEHAEQQPALTAQQDERTTEDELGLRLSRNQLR